MELENKQDMYAIAFSHGYQYGNLLDKSLMSKVLISKIVKKQKTIYYKGFMNGLDERLLDISKRKTLRKELKEIQQEIQKEKNQEIQNPSMEI
ncbi:hypothetical protein ACQY1Q_10455 [Tenacibaculum sp. TC6]|uniref:hypothetical protein n=1 Tax=Tenacibaculum sp. TC6 TaxID=3423223 RepID=UPI003D362DD8